MLKTLTGWFGFNPLQRRRLIGDKEIDNHDLRRNLFLSEAAIQEAKFKMLAQQQQQPRDDELAQNYRYGEHLGAEYDSQRD